MLNPLTGNILILGGTGLVGSALYRTLIKMNVPAENIMFTSSDDLDLTSEDDVRWFCKTYAGKFSYIFNCAARVGGIIDNSENGYEILTKNLRIQDSALRIVAHCSGASFYKYVFLGSSCVYPGNIPHPITENELLSDRLEQTNLPYAIAKIAGIVQTQQFFKNNPKRYFVAMPCNVYGPNDNFEEGGHVVAEMIRKFSSDTDDVVLFGDGRPLREFIYSDDLAAAIIRLARLPEEIGLVNIGARVDITIGYLAETIRRACRGNRGSMVWDTSKPNGTMRKKLDTRKIEALLDGWYPQTSLKAGLDETIDWYDRYVKNPVDDIITNSLGKVTHEIY